jgi:hypothetical protein
MAEEKSQTSMKDGRNKERRSEMNIEKIKEHYEHAKQKHPHFCNSLLPTDRSDEEINDEIDLHLRTARLITERMEEEGRLLPQMVLNCEVWEMNEAIANGNTAAAIEEAYDAIAVLLRVIDVLEGHQELGSPNKESEVK